MKKIFFLLVTAVIILCGCQEQETTDYSQRILKLQGDSVKPILVNNELEEAEYIPINYQVQKGIWLSYIDISKILTGKSREEFEKNFMEVCENITNLGCNTIYVHLRPFGDSLYNSNIYPASRYITGEIDSHADFDPLEIICSIAHKYKISVHGWINPLRCESEDELKKISNKYKIKQWYMEDSDKIQPVEGSNNLWLNPAYSEVRELIAQGAAEICENYEIDGIHYDDYFYPTTQESFDSECYEALGNGESLQQWRINNISLMCEEIYRAVKNVNEKIIVGISPQGNIDNNYLYMYADVKKWCNVCGYCDYIVPQIYFGYDNCEKPFLETLAEWEELVSQGNIKLVCGLGAYKIGQENEYTENVGIISNQIDDCLNDGICQGMAIYSYGSIFLPDLELNNRIYQETLLISESLND